MVEKYNPILTNVGQALILDSLASGTEIKLKSFAWGDGGGFIVNPNVSQTNLVNEVYRQDINSLYINNQVSIWLEILAIVPANVGGFYVREVGVFTENNELFCVAAHPEVYKNIPSDGATYDFREKLLVEIVNLPQVNINVGASALYVTQDDLKAHKHDNAGYNPTKINLTGGAEVQGQLPISMLADTVILNDGTVPMANNLNMSSYKINNLGNPTSAGDGMNKGYADGTYAQVAGLASQTFLVNDGSTGKQAVNFSQFPATLSDEGQCTLPNGMIMKWGKLTATISEGSYTVTFPVAFPIACLMAHGIFSNSGALNTVDMFLQLVSKSATTAVYYAQKPAGGGAGNPDGIYWMAIGH